MVLKRIFLFVVLIFALIGLISSVCLVSAFFSKEFRQAVVEQSIVKKSWPKKLGEGFPKIFGHSSESKNKTKSTIFAKMGELLDSYDSLGGSPELDCELEELVKRLKEHYMELKTCNVSQKKLRSLAYQMACLQSIIDVDRHNNLMTDQG